VGVHWVLGVLLEEAAMAQGRCVYLSCLQQKSFVDTRKVIVRMTSRNDYHEIQDSSTADEGLDINYYFRLEVENSYTTPPNPKVVNHKYTKGYNKETKSKAQHPTPHHPLPLPAPAPSTPFPSPLQQTPHTLPAPSGCAP